MKALLLCDDTQPRDVSALARQNGIGLETQSFYDPVLLEEASDALAQHRLHLDGIAPRCLHGPFGDLCPGSFDPLVQHVARHRFEQAYSVAKELQIDHMVLHHGYVPGTSAPAGWLSRSVLFWQAFFDATAGIFFHLENMLEHEPTLLREVVLAVDRPGLDVCLDIGHAHCYSRTPVVKWIERLGSLIGYVHLHDNHGTEDEHLGLGAGTIAMEEVCAALEAYAPEAVWALETQVPYLASSCRWLQERGYWPEEKQDA